MSGWSLSSVQWVAVIGMVLSSAVFYFYACRIAKEQSTLDKFLLSDRKISGKQFATTFATTSLSLASNIIFFITAHRAYGWLMAVGPMLYVAVQFLLLYFIHNLRIDLKECRTVADLCYQMFPCPLVSRMIAVLSFFTALMSLFVEIYVGAVILSIFLPETPFFQAIAFFFLSMVILGYVRKGGYKAIVITDGWQFKLIFLACLAMLVFSLKIPIIASNAPSVREVAVQIWSYQESGVLLGLFLIWACVNNVCACFTDVTIWQRMAASVSAQEAFKGLWKGIWKTIFIFWVPMMAFVLLCVKGYSYGSMAEYLALVENTFSGSLWGYLLFPVIVVGFSSTLFSTADSNMIATFYSLCDRNTFRGVFDALPEERKPQVLTRYLPLFFVVIFILLSIFYYIESRRIGTWFMPLLYAIWGQMAIVAPLPIYALCRLKRQLPILQVTRRNSAYLISGLVVGWGSILCGLYLEILTGRPLFSHVFFLLSLGSVSGGVWLVVREQPCHSVDMETATLPTA